MGKNQTAIKKQNEMSSALVPFHFQFKLKEY